MRHLGYNRRALSARARVAAVLLDDDRYAGGFRVRGAVLRV